jgi:PPP family 3-phenylpropionic acid transporter
MKTPWIRYILYFFSFFSIVAVFSPNLSLFLKELGYDYSQIGFINAGFQLVGLVAPLVVGAFVDRFRIYKYTLITLLVLVVPLFFLVPMAGNFWLVLGLFIVIGFLSQPQTPVADALISHSIPDPVHNYGKLRPAGSVGYLVTALALDALAVFHSDVPRRFPVALAVTTAVTVVILITLPRASHFEEPAAVTDSGNGKPPAGKIPPFFWLVSAGLFLAWLGFTCYNAFYTLYLRDVVGLAGTNLYWAFGALFEIPMIFFSGHLIRRFGFKKLLVTGCLALSLRLILYTLLPFGWYQIPSQVFHAFSFGLLQSAGIGFINHYIPRARRGTGMAVYASVIRCGSAVVGNAAGGLVAKQWGIPFLFTAASAVPVLAAILFLFWKEGHRRIILKG